MIASIAAVLELDRFRRSVLSRILVVGAVMSAGFSAFAVLEDFPIPLLQAVCNALFALECGLLFLCLRLRPEYGALYAAIFIVSAFALFCAAAVLVPADPWRFAWFFPLVAAAFLLFGTLAGVLIACASVAVTVIVALTIGGISLLSLGTGIGALASTTLICHAFVDRARRSISSAASAAYHDTLTGLANRRSFEALLGVLRQGAKPFGLLYLDVDHFKRINDNHGHAVGDQVLLAITELLNNAVGPNDSPARIGGEEFAILVPDGHEDLSLRIAERVRTMIAATPIKSGDIQLAVTVSIGIAVSHFPHSSGQDILEQADRALYEAKRRGRNQTVIGLAKEPP